MIRAIRMAIVMKANKSAVTQVSDSAAAVGSVFRNLMNAPPPPPPPPPAPPAEYKPVKPSVEPSQTGQEPKVSTSAETKAEAVRSGVTPGVKGHAPTASGKNTGGKPMFTADDLRRNFVMTEVLGKPVALRRK